MEQFLYLSSFSILIPAILAGINMRRAVSRLFNLFVILGLFTEILLAVMGQKHENNWLVIYGYLLIELGLLGYVLSDLMPSQPQRVNFKITTALVFVAAVLLFFLKEYEFMHYFQNAVLIVFSGSFLYFFVDSSDDLELWSSGKFWIGAALFFYFFCNSLVTTLIQPMLSQGGESLEFAFMILLESINLITYAMVSIAVVKRS